MAHSSVLKMLCGALFSFIISSHTNLKTKYLHLLQNGEICEYVLGEVIQSALFILPSRILTVFVLTY